MRPTLLLLFAAWANAADILTDFQPSAIRSDAGSAMEVEFSTPLVELEPGALAHHQPRAMRDFRFAEKVWVIGYTTALSDANGAAPKENYLCHTFLSDQRMDQHEDKEVKGIYSDAFTPEVRMPAGYGIPILAGENLHWMPMFNNRGDAAVRVSMRIRLTVIRERDRKTAIKPLYASLRSVQVPHLFFVEPGGDRRESIFHLPFNGRIHFMGTHIHPYGVSVELKNLSRNERVWIGTRKAGPESAMDTYASSEGYRFRAGESFRLTSIYDNPLKGRIDAMAGLFLLYSRD